jgi:hypothetical protein
VVVTSAAPHYTKNGLAMASKPSSGHTNMTVVPLHTTRPRVRLASVTVVGSAGSGQVGKGGAAPHQLFEQVTRHAPRPPQPTSHHSPRRYSVQSSSTKFTTWSKPFRMPVTGAGQGQHGENRTANHQVFQNASMVIQHPNKPCPLPPAPCPQNHPPC